MSEYFISYYTENPRELYCRCSIVSLSNEGLDIFERESGIGNIPALVLEYIKDIPFGTVEERYRHDEALRKFNDVHIVIESLEEFADRCKKKKPSNDSEHIGMMRYFIRLAENINAAEDKTKTTDIRQDSPAESNPCPTLASKPRRGAPGTPRNKYFIKQSEENPDKSPDDLIKDFNGLPRDTRGAMFGDATPITTKNDINREEAKSIPNGAKAKRQELQALGVIKDCVFERDYTFNTDSTAACVVSGASFSGNGFWKGLKAFKGGGTE